MKRFTLTRVAGGPHGTFGVLHDGKIPICCTCEDNWRHNEPFISCIPAGIYQCAPYSSPKYKDVWEVKDVEDRTHILIHAGNTYRDTSGCILVGKAFTMFYDTPGVNNSRDTLDKLREVLPDNFELEIIDAVVHTVPNK